MKLLLDTHIWLWFRSETEKLGRTVSLALGNEENELWLSPISTWEALTLHSRGRIQLAGDLGHWVERATEGINEAVVTHEIVSVAQGMQMHKDPADRMIAATAIVHDMTLVTADERLLELPGLTTLANR